MTPLITDLPQQPSTLFFETRSLIEPGAHMGLGMHTTILMGAGNLNPGFYACIINNFHTYSSLFFKDLFIVTCEYTVAVVRHTRRGHQISLRMVVSHHVVAGIWTQDLWKSNQWVLLPTEPSLQPQLLILSKTDFYEHSIIYLLLAVGLGQVLFLQNHPKTKSMVWGKHQSLLHANT